MAVVEMGKLNLIAMSYDRDALLNALQRTGATEIKLHSEAENTSVITQDCEGLREYLLKVDTALERLSSATDAYNKEHKIKSDLLKDGFEISYSQFMSAKDMKGDIDALVEKINALYDVKKELSAELAKLRRTIATAKIYSSLQSPLKIADTQHTKFCLGTLPSSAVEKITLNEHCFLKTLVTNGDQSLIFAAYHKSVSAETEGVLTEAGFSACPFNETRTGEEFYNSLLNRENEIFEEWVKNSEDTYALNASIRDLKIYSDYLAYELEKAELAEKLRATQVTFLLEAYVPQDREEDVKQAVLEVSEAVYFEFSAPADDEVPPTLLSNNKVVKNFEAVTNMYSPPSSKEFDPNTVMAFFYSIFLGFIMADVGYGLLMILGGGFIWMKMKRGGMIRQLGGVFAVGGIFTVIWGFLFNSFFGFGLLPFKVMPDMSGENMSWTVAAVGGIKVPALLIVSMIIGVVQIFTGYVCKAVQCWRKGQIADGIFDGVTWAVFSVGVCLAIAGFIKEFNVPVLRLVGGIIAGVGLLTAIVTAGRKEKLLGKFTKGFGAAYGVINYASDILSYARLYGLMLAGATIATIIAEKSVALITSGNAAFAIIGVLIIIIGHIFNLAIGLLGAYIHDARLQYVEFYGRFYEGEGRLFAPLGSTHKHVYIID